MGVEEEDCDVGDGLLLVRAKFSPCIPVNGVGAIFVSGKFVEARFLNETDFVRVGVEDDEYLYRGLAGGVESDGSVLDGEARGANLFSDDL